MKPKQIDLAKLNVDELEKLLEELNRRSRRNAYLRYHPHAYQKQVHSAVSSHRITLMCGGNGIGKTTLIANEVWAWVIGKRHWDGSRTRLPPNQVLWAGPDFTNYHPKKAIPSLLQVAPLENWKSVKKNNNGVINELEHENGSIVSFMSYEQHLRKPPDQASPYEGIDWHFACLDEPTMKDIFIPVQRGVMKLDGKILMVLTPIAEPWIWDELYMPAAEDPDIFAITVSAFEAVKTAENPNGHIDADALQAYINTISGSEEEQARIYGKFSHLVGRVFRDWDPMIHTFDPEKFEIRPEWPKGLTIDPHDRRPFFMVWWAVNPDGQILFFKEWPTDPFHVKKDNDNRWEDYAEFIKEEEKKIPGGVESVKWRICDPNFGRQIKAASGENLVDFMSHYGMYFDTDIDDSLLNGHASVRRRLSVDKAKPMGPENKPGLLVSKNLWNIIYGFEHYLWAPLDEQRVTSTGKTPKDRVREHGKDAMDTVRYTAGFKPQFCTPEMMRPKLRLRGLANSGLGGR